MARPISPGIYWKEQVCINIVGKLLTTSIWHIQRNLKYIVTLKEHGLQNLNTVNSILFWLYCIVAFFSFFSPTDFVSKPFSCMNSRRILQTVLFKRDDIFQIPLYMSDGCHHMITTTTPLWIWRNVQSKHNIPLIIYVDDTLISRQTVGGPLLEKILAITFVSIF
jgi:hypothetical protein